MSNDKALDLALEALLRSRKAVAGDYHLASCAYGSNDPDGHRYQDAKKTVESVKEAINAIKQARSAPVQEPVQEPVGEIGWGGSVNWHKAIPEFGTDLYTTPPAQPAPENLWLYWKVDDKSVVTGPFKTHLKDEAYGPDCIDATPLTVPAPVPDAIIEAGESPEFRDGWNECRETMLQMLKARNT